MKQFALFLFSGLSLYAQSYPPSAGNPGSTAIYKDSPSFVAWANGVEITRGYINIANQDITINGSHFVSSGNPEYALGIPDGPAVSLGDGGEAVLTFPAPIVDGEGFDFAVFENGTEYFLELAFVEVSSDGIHFFRFPSHSETQTETQIGTFGSPQAQYLNNLAGKYAGTYGTPFDISELPDDEWLDKQHITHVKVVDVVGSIDPLYGSLDAHGNLVNDSFPTPFAAGGFDLQAVGVIHQLELQVSDNQLNGLKICPNPVSDKIKIIGVKDAIFSVYDMTGKVLIDKSIMKEGKIDVTSFSRGMYILKIQGDDGVKIIKFLKN